MTSIGSDPMCQSQKNNNDTLNSAHFIKKKRKQVSLSITSGLLQKGLTGFPLCPIVFHSTYLSSHPEAQKKKGNLNGGAISKDPEMEIRVFGVRSWRPLNARWLVYS